MADLDLQSLNPETGAAPTTRIKDAASLNAVVKKLIERDAQAAVSRMHIQKMLDGAPPFNPQYLRDSGQEGRCNLNFGDAKRALKSEMAGYYDLTESVPTIAQVITDFGDPAEQAYYNGVLSEEFHRMLKDWKQFDTYFQLLVQKFCSHGLGFLYFRDDIDWRWQVAGLEDFKVPRNTTLSEDETDIALALRDITIAQLYKWIKDIPNDSEDKRWNLKECRQAILKASDSQLVYSDGAWEKFQTMMKNNDLYVSTTAQESVALAHVWVREFSGRISQYITLRNGGNMDYLFKCENRFDGVDQCFTFFPYEVGTNGLLHSVRGLAHDIYPQVQVLNDLRGQQVNNAKLSGSLLIQPKTETDAEDMAVLFYAGCAYLPPNVSVVNGNLTDTSKVIKPVIDSMSLLMRENVGDVNTRSPGASQREKTKFQVQAELTREAVLPTAAMNLFYQPWGRHLNEVWRRVRECRSKDDPGGEEVWALRERCMKRGVPKQAIDQALRVVPMRAVGYGSPQNRLMAFDEFMQYYGSLDAVGQNNLLRDRFAQRVGYGMVDRYVMPLEQSGRAPVDVEIAELQNAAMSSGVPVSVLPNDQHILHLQSHMPSLTADLDELEHGQASTQLLQVAQIKTQHCADHLKLLKPDKLQEQIVRELQRQFNNAAQRTQAATEHANVIAQKEQEAAAQAQGAAAPSPEAQQKAADHQLDMQMRQESHAQDMQISAEKARQHMAIEDSKEARRVRHEALRARLGLPPTPTPAATVPEVPAAPAPAPEPNVLG